MSEPGARDVAGIVVRFVAGIAGAVLALFGGGCVVLMVLMMMSGGSGFSDLGVVVGLGVLPLVAGIRLLRWATRKT